MSVEKRAGIQVREFGFRPDFSSTPARCYGLNYAPPNANVKALTPSVTVLGDRACKEVITLKEVI